MRAGKLKLCLFLELMGPLIPILLSFLASVQLPMTAQNSDCITSAGGIHTSFWKDTLSLLRHGCSLELFVVFGPSISCFL